MQPVSVAAHEPQQTADTPCPPPRKRVILLSLVALIAGAAATFWFDTLQYERFSGFLQARLRTVAAGHDAQISEILVAPGMGVAAGEPLVRLKDPAFEQRYDAKQRQVESLEIELAQNQARLEVELEWRRKNILERIFDAKLKCSQALRQQLQAAA